MPHDARIIVLNTIKYKDSGIVIQAYSDRGGRESFFFRNGKNSRRNGIISQLHPLNILDITFSSFSLGEITAIKEFSTPYKLESIRSNLVKSSMAIYMSELISKSIREIESNSRMYSFLTDAVLQLECSKEELGNFHLYFTVQLCRHIGYLPEIRNVQKGYLFDIPSAGYVTPDKKNPYCFNEKNSEILGLFASSEYIRYSGIMLTGTARSEFIGDMLRYLAFHAGDDIKINSLDIMHQVFI